MNEGTYLSLEEMISIPSLSSPAVSEDGNRVAWVRRAPHWDSNEYREHVSVYDGVAGSTSTVTAGETQSKAPAWSSRGALAWLSSTGEGDDASDQIFVLDRGETCQVTHGETGVLSYCWAPDGRGIFYLAPDPDQHKAMKRRRKKFGDFAYWEHDGVWNRLFYISLEQGRAKSRAPSEAPKDLREKDDENPARILTGDSTWHILAFDIASDGERAAFIAVPSPDHPGNAEQASLFTCDIDEGHISPVEVKRPLDSFGKPLFSADGSQLCYATVRGEGKLFNIVTPEILDLDTGNVERPLSGIDECIYPVRWTERGLVFTWQQRTDWYVSLLNSDGEVIPLRAEPGQVTLEASVTRDGRHLATITAETERPFEVLLNERAVTDQYRHYRDRALSKKELVQWQSRDGTAVEGVLVAAPDLDPDVRHPLLVLVHGGPTWAAFAVPSHDRYYPYEQFIERGFVILDVNYRGSSGYGGAFRKLNYRNLGVGDCEDVLSGVDALVEQGLADPDRVGIMGWSQGGYISAMCCTYTDRFAAVSVGAGISSWYTYYNNTDIPMFTRHYLGDTPWKDPDIYDRTSPIHYIEGACTPTLIQHGERDARVPFANARELHRGLSDMGVDVELVVFRGMGHGADKPGVHRAIMQQNYAWFCHHLLGEPLDGFWLSGDGES